MCFSLSRFVEIGDEVHEFDKICEVQSDKATVEITSRYHGKIARLHYGVGDMAKVGQVRARCIMANCGKLHLRGPLSWSHLALCRSGSPRTGTWYGGLRIVSGADACDGERNSAVVIVRCVSA